MNAMTNVKIRVMEGRFVEVPLPGGRTEVISKETFETIRRSAPAPVAATGGTEVLDQISKLSARLDTLLGEIQPVKQPLNLDNPPMFKVRGVFNDWQRSFEHALLSLDFRGRVAGSLKGRIMTVNAPRGCGKTTFIAEMLHRRNDIAVVTHHHESQIDYALGEGARGRVVSVNSINKEGFDQFRGMKGINTLILEEPAHFHYCTTFEELNPKKDIASWLFVNRLYDENYGLTVFALGTEH